MEYLFNQQEVIDVLIKKYVVNVFRDRNTVVLIGGCSRSGKSTLTNMLLENLEKRNINSISLSLDNWLLSVEKRENNSTVRDRYNYEKIVKDVNKILAGEKTKIPKYDCLTRKSVYSELDDAIKFNGEICVVEGVVALDINALRDISNLNIYVEVDDATRLKRLHEFYVDHKKLDKKEAKEIIDWREMEEVPAIKNTKKFADYIFKV